MLLHDALNVLSPNANDSLVVLIRYVEGYRSRHLLLDEGQSRLHRLVVRAAYVDVEVVFIEPIEDDLDAACI